MVAKWYHTEKSLYNAINSFKCPYTNYDPETTPKVRFTRRYTKKNKENFRSTALEISLGAIPRGFESHPLRQKAIRFCEWLFSCCFAEKAAFSRTKSSEIRPTNFCLFSHFSSLHSLIFSGVLPQFYPFSTSS